MFVGQDDEREPLGGVRRGERLLNPAFGHMVPKASKLSV